MITGPAFTLASVALLAAGGGAVAVHHHNSGHPDQHWVSGHADVRDVRVVPQRGVPCSYEKGIVYVPIYLRWVRHSGAEGWLTFHVSAAVSYRSGGEVKVASATTDIASGSSGGGDSVRVPFDGANWQPSVNHCALTTWTMTPGAWLWNDD